MLHRFSARVVALLGCRRAATAVEYGLICALIVLGILISVRGLATEIIALWGNVGTSVVSAGKP